MIQPFCCDITTGSIEEQNEFKRLFRAVSKYDWKFGASYYGVDLDRKFANEFNKHSAKHWFNNNFIPLSEGIAILKKMVGEEEEPKEDISIYVKSIRSNFEMWQKGEIKDGTFAWHLQNNLLHIEKIIQPTE